MGSVITLSEASRIIASHRRYKDSKDERAKRKAPNPEKLRAAVAAVVLAEFELWPVDVQALIGSRHPAKKEFDKGVTHVIGVYMSIAKSALQERVRAKIRKAEADTTNNLSTLFKKITELKDQWRSRIDNSVKGLEIERAQRLKKAKDLIHREYESKIAKARNLSQPEELVILLGQEKDVKAEYEKYRCRLTAYEAGVMKEISGIDKVKHKWNSKKRRDKRSSEKDGGQKGTEV